MDTSHTGHTQHSPLDQIVNAAFCDCRGCTRLLARYRRPGPRPLHTGGFYSFVEDWDRGPGAAGHATIRRAEFRHQQARLDGVPANIASAVFTKAADRSIADGLS